MSYHTYDRPYLGNHMIRSYLLLVIIVLSYFSFAEHARIFIISNVLRINTYLFGEHHNLLSTSLPFPPPPPLPRLSRLSLLSLLPILLSFNPMATQAATRYPLRISSQISASHFNSAARRNLATFQLSTSLKNPCARIKSTASISPLQQSYRRSYADARPPTVRRKGGFFKWAWRLTYLSTIAGTGYLSWVIYELRTPPEQLDVDPSKKTLVILGP